MTRERPGEPRIRASTAGDRLQSAALTLIVALLVAVPLTPPYLIGVRAKSIVFMGLAFSIGACALAAAVRRGRLDVPLSPGGLGLLLLAGAAVIATPSARFTDTALEALPFLWAVVVLHFATVSLLRARMERGASVAALLRVGLGAGLIAAIFVSAFGLIGFFRFQSDLSAGTATEASRSAYLATPFFEHSYLAAQAILPMVPAAAALVLVGKNRFARLVGIAAIVPVCAFIATILSRAAWLAIVAGLAFTLLGALYAYRSGRRSAVTTARPARPSTAAIATGGAALLALFLAWVGALGETVHGILRRFTSLADPEMASLNFSRLRVWEDTLRMIGDHLPLGVGPGSFGFELGHYHVGTRLVAHAHNQYLQTLAELGSLGLTGLLLALVYPLVLCWRSLAKPQQPALFARLGAGGGLTALVVFGLFESPLQFATSAALFALFGAVAVSLVPERGERIVPLDSDVARRPAEPTGRWLTTSGLAAGGLAVLLMFAAAPTARIAWGGHLGYRTARALAADDPEEAARLAAEAREIAPHIPEVLRIEADARAALGDTAGAAEAYARHEAVLPGLSDALLRHAAALLALERYEEAVSVLIRAQARAIPESEPDVTVELAYALARARRYEDARLLLLDLMTRRHHVARPIVLLRLAEVQLNLGRDRRLVVDLLTQYQNVVPEREARYAATLLEEIDAYYPGWAAGTPRREGDANSDGR